MKYINEYNDYEQKLLDQGKPYYYVASIVKNLEVKYIGDYPEKMLSGKTFFVHKDTGEIWMRNNENIDCLYVSEVYIWSKIKSKFSYSDSKISKLIKYTVEIAFKMSVGRPIPSDYLP